MFHLKSNSWNLSDNYSPTPILNRMRSPGHPTPMPRALLFARSLSAFRPGNLVNFAFKKLKVQHKRFQIVSNQRKNRSNNPFSKARKTSESKNSNRRIKAMTFGPASLTLDSKAERAFALHRQNME